MKYIKLFESDDFLPLPETKNFSIYYDIYSEKSVEKFDIALEKLGVKNAFYDNIFKLPKVVKKSGVCYLLIDDWEFYVFDKIPTHHDKWIYGGEIHISEYDLNVKKYNL